MALSAGPQRRTFLPSRPAPSKFLPGSSTEDGRTHPMDPQDLIGMTRVGGASVAPDGALAVFSVREYQFEAKKWADSIYLMDLARAESMGAAELERHEHLTKLAADGSSPVFSPCGAYVAFLSARGENQTTAVWLAPARGPGEAQLLKEFPLPVGDLTWPPGAGGIIVSANVYVDAQAATEAAEAAAPPSSASSSSPSVPFDAMAATAARDKKLADGKALGGLNAVLFKRESGSTWDGSPTWLNG